MSQEKFRTEILPIREKLFHIARQILVEDEDAEDAVQEVLLKLWHTHDSLDRYNSPAAFAITVTKNHCIDKLRVRKDTERLEDFHQYREAEDNPQLSLERKDSGEIIRKIISGLPPLQQMIIRMKDLEEYEVDEIAEITGTNQEAVRANLSRARRKVREEYLKWSKL